jgi:hypothetical protein
MHYLGRTAIIITVRRVKFALELIVPVPALFKQLFVLKIVKCATRNLRGFVL